MRHRTDTSRNLPAHEIGYGRTISPIWDVQQIGMPASCLSISPAKNVTVLSLANRMRP